MRPWVQTFGALVARDIRVLRRNFGQFLIRTIMQPLLFVFVFALPEPPEKISTSTMISTRAMTITTARRTQ